MVEVTRRQTLAFGAGVFLTDLLAAGAVRAAGKDTLTIAFRNRWNDPRRPTDFEPRNGVGIYVLARKKP